jgi:hypothetical protein
VLASCHPKSTIFKKGGSPLGINFLDMIASKNNAASQLHTWVAAKAIQIINVVQVEKINPRKKVIATAVAEDNPAADFDMGRLIVLYLTPLPNFHAHFSSDLGSLAKNVHEICVKLQEMICISILQQSFFSCFSFLYRCCKWKATWLCLARRQFEKNLDKMKIRLHIAKNNWNICKSDVLQPLEKLHKAPAVGVLACIHTKKITLTYQDTSPPSDTKEEEDASKDSDEETEHSLTYSQLDPSNKTSQEGSPKKSGRPTNNSALVKRPQKKKPSTISKNTYLLQLCKNNQQNQTRESHSNTALSSNPPALFGNSSGGGKLAPTSQTAGPALDPMLHGLA